MSLSPENFDGLGVAAAKTNRSTSPDRPQRLAPLPKSGVSGQTLGTLLLYGCRDLLGAGGRAVTE
jgi:hypothetical protein